MISLKASKVKTRNPYVKVNTLDFINVFIPVHEFIIIKNNIEFWNDFSRFSDIPALPSFPIYQMIKLYSIISLHHLNALFVLNMEMQFQIQNPILCETCISLWIFRMPMRVDEEFRGPKFWVYALIWVKWPVAMKTIMLNGIW